MLSDDNNKLVTVSVTHTPAEPLWQRVPIRTAAGEFAADFMMLITRFNRLHQRKQREILQTIHEILKSYSEIVIFADLNTRINLLWISHKPRPGIGLELAAVIHDYVPEAKLISHQQRP